MDLERRARAHAALGDPARLAIVDELTLTDRTVTELAESVGMRGNLLAHHLQVLEEAGLIWRRPSEGDRRRRYVSLHPDGLPPGLTPRMEVPDRVAFVCTHNSARSQYAAAVWEQKTGKPAASAGSHPATRVHPSAVRVAAERGIDLSKATPGGYDRLRPKPHLLISVCDMAREAGIPPVPIDLHWSIPDPVRVERLAAFRSAFDEIERRMDRLLPATKRG